MAHFAKISEENKVLNVVVVDDKHCRDENGNESETIGQGFLEANCNWPAHLWIQCSYNTRLGEHIKVKNVERGEWVSPIGLPPELTQEQKDQNAALTHWWGYVWNEENQSWDLTNSEA